MLEEVGTDRDLVGEDQPIVRTWPAWILYDGVDALFKIGPTIATKLLARKRPRLLPIIDDVVRTVVDSTAVWEPLRLVLREDGCALHERLLRLHRDVQLPPQVSPLRVFDVIAWVKAKASTMAPGAAEHSLTNRVRSGPAAHRPAIAAPDPPRWLIPG